MEKQRTSLFTQREIKWNRKQYLKKTFQKRSGFPTETFDIKSRRTTTIQILKEEWMIQNYTLNQSDI